MKLFYTVKASLILSCFGVRAPNSPCLDSYYLKRSGVVLESIQGTDTTVFKSIVKLKFSEPYIRVNWFYKNGFTTTKNKPYFVRLVDKLVEYILLYNSRYVVA